MPDQPSLKDHRQIAQELDLFSFHEEAPGAIFWHGKGWFIYQTLVNFVRQKLSEAGRYQEISTPVMIKSKLFEKSGHFQYYQENMFNFTIDEELNSLKPMNCPESCLIYQTKTRSYQDLPIRYADFGILHRNELSGTLGGAFRVRQFSIDDAHHFIRPDQIQKEIHELLLLVVDFYTSFGFKPEFYLSTKPDKAMGDPKLWERAEEDLRQALKDSGVAYGIKEKDGAFYGPKIDIHIKDSQNRDWQLATVQLDFQIPEKMNLEYIDSDGKPQRPVIVHRAILGSVERFIGILTEHFQGAFPLWLSPVQLTIVPIADRHTQYALGLADELKEHTIRVETDVRNESMQSKIRDATLQKVPFMGIIGDKELASNNKLISIRTRQGKDMGQISLLDFIQKVKLDIDKKI